MFIKRFAFILLFISTAQVDAEVYKCMNGENVSFSSLPCHNQQINLELDDNAVQSESRDQERFITPIYSNWKNGWKKTKDIKLARFSEVIYEARNASQAQQATRINLQKLNNLPQSMTVQRFAISVEDIIDSICVSTRLYQPKVQQVTSNVLYGQYACSLRRDTQQGEFGYYKIMRGENSMYMVAVKWAVAPFNIEQGKPLAAMKREPYQSNMLLAQRYLQNEVRLCHAQHCIQ